MTKVFDEYQWSLQLSEYKGTILIREIDILMY